MNKLEKILSKERLTRYKSYNEPDSFNLYIFNLILSQALYPSIAIFEVCIRNKLDFVLSKYIDSNWLSTNFLLDFESESLENILTKLNKHKKPINRGNIISNLTLGFWIGLFDNKYNTKIWDKAHIFENVFPNFNNRIMQRKKVVYSVIKEVHQIRNKISHHEAIFDYKSQNGSNLFEFFCKFEELMFWLSDEAWLLFNQTNNFKQVWNSNIFILSKNLHQN